MRGCGRFFRFFVFRVCVCCARQSAYLVRCPARSLACLLARVRASSISRTSSRTSHARLPRLGAPPLGTALARARSRKHSRARTHTQPPCLRNPTSCRLPPALSLPTSLQRIRSTARALEPSAETRTLPPRTPPPRTKSNDGSSARRARPRSICCRRRQPPPPPPRRTTRPTTASPLSRQLPRESL